MMTTEELAAIEARATAALPYRRSVLREGADSWGDATPGEQSEDSEECPLCGGDGDVQRQRYDDATDRASTIVAYGIGDGLPLAEAWVEHGAADALALVAEVRQLNEALSEAEDRATTLENEADDAAD